MHATRRNFLKHAVSVGMVVTWPAKWAWAGPGHARATRVLAAWQLQQNGQHQVGLLDLTQHGPRFTEHVCNVPSRPHGLTWLGPEECLVVARRPGDWLMRIHWGSGQMQRHWLDHERSLNGHALRLAQEPWFYTTETDRYSGQGRLVKRDLQSLETIDVWPTLGQDPHALIALPAGVAGLQQGSILVANGGIPTHAQMGRAKVNLDDMDSSLVAMHPGTGEVLGRWQLEDRLLSLRHLALNRAGNTVAVAMQAQHAKERMRHASPVLALLNASGLKAVPSSTSRGGYAGDVVAMPNGFAYSCTLHNTVCTTNTQGELLHERSLQQPCALAYSDAGLHCGQQQEGWAMALDNHWLVKPT
ncbi:DUF1513 domain-containing protein [Limnobacter sp.]|uniref:DUF1513 domain-containing protein n=1 Tax=Limnobacter sp. TaxID=2003368 RepID=UPI00351473CC